MRVLATAGALEEARAPTPPEVDQDDSILETPALVDRLLTHEMLGQDDPGHSLVVNDAEVQTNPETGTASGSSSTGPGASIESTVIGAESSGAEGGESTTTGRGTGAASSLGVGSGASAAEDSGMKIVGRGTSKSM